MVCFACHLANPAQRDIYLRGKIWPSMWPEGFRGCTRRWHLQTWVFRSLSSVTASEGLWICIPHPEHLRLPETFFYSGFLKSPRILRLTPELRIQYNDLSALQFVSWNRQEFLFIKILNHKGLKPITTFNDIGALKRWQLCIINFHNTLQHLMCSHMH